MTDCHYYVIMHYTAIKAGGSVEQWSDAVTNTTSMMALMDAVKAAMDKLLAMVAEIMDEDGFRLILVDSFSVTYETPKCGVVSVRYEVVRG